jgi:hypothetical protein
MANWVSQSYMGRRGLAEGANFLLTQAGRVRLGIVVDAKIHARRLDPQTLSAALSVTLANRAELNAAGPPEVRRLPTGACLDVAAVSALTPLSALDAGREGCHRT